MNINVQQVSVPICINSDRYQTIRRSDDGGVRGIFFYKFLSVIALESELQLLHILQHKIGISAQYVVVQ